MADEGSMSFNAGHGGSLLADVAETGGSLGLYTGGSATLRAPATTSARNSPYARTPNVRTPGGTISHATEHGEFLEDKLDYIVPPTLTPVERETPVNARTVFMGHMRFETTAAEVRWLIRRLTGVTPLKAEPRSKGCFLVHLATEADEVAVRGLHRRMLMDHHGVWVARNPQEAQVLSDYVDFVLSRGPKQKRLRLPKDCVTVETPHQRAPTAPGAGSPPISPTGQAPGAMPYHDSPHLAPPPAYGHVSPHNTSAGGGTNSAGGSPSFGRGSRPPASPPAFGSYPAPDYGSNLPPPPYVQVGMKSPSVVVGGMGPASTPPPPYRGPA